MVNKAFAKAYLGGGDPVGKRIRFTFSDKNPYLEIVGVTGDTAAIDLATPAPPMIYSFNDQGPSTFLSYMVRTAGDPAAFVGAARAALHEMDPQLPLIQPQSLEEIANQSPSVFFRRYPSYLIGSFAVLAMALAMIGLYGLISYTVQQRTREIGIRVALGAESRDIFQMVLGQGMRAALLGIGARRDCGPGRDATVGECTLWSEPWGLDYVHGRRDAVVDRGGGGVFSAGTAGDEGGSDCGVAIRVMVYVSVFEKFWRWRA